MAKHILNSSQFDSDKVERLFQMSDEINQKIDHKREKELLRTLPGNILFSFFCEESTRTRFSFETAGMLLGMHVIGTENAKKFSSMVKGESLRHSIRTMCELRANAIVLRHSTEGSAKEAAEIADPYGVSILNAGDGKGEHPSQALLDIYTIRNSFDKLENLAVACGGDLANGRTVRSLVRMLSSYDDISFRFFSPRELQMKQDVLDHLEKHGQRWRVCKTMEEALKGADVIYWTRSQLERFTSWQKIGRYFRALFAGNGKYIIGKHEMETWVKPDAILMHPLPIKDEIEAGVDNDSRSKYFEQVKNGLLVRMALLKYCLQ